MSFWGATVITRLLSAFGPVGAWFVKIVWGGFVVNQATLTRFFALHFLLPLAGLVLILAHVYFLHHKGSSTPAGTNIIFLRFIYYFVTKDLVGFLLFMLVLGRFVFFSPTFFLDGENRIYANPIVTPLHIVPEWYFLFAYCILKSIESKIGGVLALGVRVLLIPILRHLPGFGGGHKLKVFFLIGSFIILTALGGYELGPYFLGLARVARVVYFSIILIL